MRLRSDAPQDDDTVSYMGICASDRKERGSASSLSSGASPAGAAFFRRELEIMIGRENDGKSRREGRRDGSRSVGDGDSTRPDLRLPQSEVARNELSRELNMHFNSPTVLARMWDAYTAGTSGMTLSALRILVTDVLVRSTLFQFFGLFGFPSLFCDALFICTFSFCVIWCKT